MRIIENYDKDKERTPCMQFVRSCITEGIARISGNPSCKTGSSNEYAVKDGATKASSNGYAVKDPVMNETINGDVVMGSRFVVMLSNVKLSFSFSENDFTPVYYIIIYISYL